MAPKKLSPIPPRDQSGTVVKNYRLGEVPCQKLLLGRGFQKLLRTLLLWQVLGRGSNGVVYKSLNIDTGDVVAIKQAIWLFRALRSLPITC